MKDSLNIRHLRVFLEVVDSKSISKASLKVFLSQPAITQALSKLETALGTQLFDRRSDGMYATETGDVFANRVRRALAEIADSLRIALRGGVAKGRSRTPALIAAMTTTQLRALIAVVEAQNFSVASRTLGISQSSLHRAARELESQLEVVLFEKTSTGISATKAARTLARGAKLAFAEIQQGREEVAAAHNREIGRIVVGSMPLARTSVLPAAILAFTDAFPGFGISVNDGPYDDLLSHLRHGDIDVLIGALRFPLPSEDVIQEELFRSEIGVVGRPGHPLLGRGSVSAEALAQYPWVVARSSTPTRRLFDQCWQQAGLDAPEGLVETGSQVLIRSLLADSDRLTMISRHQIQYELNTGLLVSIPFDLKEASRPIGITLRRGWRPTATQSRFVECLREQAAELRDS